MPHGGHLVAVRWWSNTRRQGSSVGGRSRCARSPGTGNPNSPWSAPSVDEFPNRPITILRPPMILGPRDRATLPLFRMARGAIRIKPGFRTKSYSFIAVEDLVAAIFLALESEPLAQSCYVASAQSMTDWQLIASAAAACHAQRSDSPGAAVWLCECCRLSWMRCPALRAQSAKPDTRPGAGNLAATAGSLTVPSLHV